MSRIQIEKNVPIYPARDKYRMKEMEVGDSVLVKDMERVSSLVSYYSRKLGRKFTSRKEEGGVRIWRIK